MTFKNTIIESVRWTITLAAIALSLLAYLRGEFGEQAYNAIQDERATQSAIVVTANAEVYSTAFAVTQTLEALTTTPQPLMVVVTLTPAPISIEQLGR